VKKFTIFGLSIIFLSALALSVNAQYCKVDTFTTWAGLLDDNPSSIAINKKNHVVTRHYGGISYYNGTTWKAYNNPMIQGGGFAIDESDYIWCSSYYTGLVKIKDTIVATYDTSNGLPGMFINDIEIGPDGMVYIAIGEYGLSIFDGTKFTNYDTADGVCDPYIGRLTFNKYGEIYLGSMNGCISKFDGTKFTTLPKIKPVGGESEIGRMAVDNNDNLWVILTNWSGNTKSEIHIFDVSKNKWSRFNSPVDSSTFINDIAFDANGFLWLLTTDRLYKWDGYKWHNYSALALGINGYRHFALDKEDNLWITSESGVGRLTQTVKTEIKTNVTAGYVIYYKYSSSGVKSFVKYDSVAATAFVSKDLPAGKYIVYLKPDPTKHPDLAGTYYGDVATSQEASHIELAFCDSFYMFQVSPVKLPPPNPAGKGYISGYVKSTDGTRGVAEPIKDVDVTLKKVPGGVIKIAKTNQSGLYEFTQLDTGVYSVWVDLPGLYQDSVPVVKITPTDTSHKNKDFEVDSNGIHIGDFSGINHINLSNNIKVYPNPAYSKFFVDLKLEKYQNYTIEVVSMQSQRIAYISKTGIGNITETIYTSDLNAGIYLVKIVAGNDVSLLKLIIR